MMDRTEMEALLRQVRRARCGTLPLPTPEPIASYLGHGLGYLCDTLASWFEGLTTEQRSSDAAIRYFGLGRMPEPQSSIAQSLPKRGERKGLTRRRLQQQIDQAINQIDVQPLRLAAKPLSSAAMDMADPFSIPTEASTRLVLLRAVLWAWADVTDPTGNDAVAVLLYEFDHGLRAWSPPFGHDQTKWRARRRAWSMLDVALYRTIEATPSSPILDRMLGPRQIITLEPEAVAEWQTLIDFNRWPELGDPHAAISAVAGAVAAHRPEATDLLGLLRGGVIRLRHPPEDVIARVMTLSVIAGRQRRDPAGIVVAEQLLSHLGEVIRRRPIGSEARARVAAVQANTLRAAQEAAQLSYALGDMERARRLITAAHRALNDHGDPEQETQPDGRMQQLLLFDASWLRRHAVLSSDPMRSLRWADKAAGSSSDLVFDSGVLPITWGLASEEQRIGAILDKGERDHQAGNEHAAVRVVRYARELIAAQDRNWLSVPQVNSRLETPIQVRTGLLGAARASWRAALLDGDREEIEASRALTWQRMGPWTPPTLVDKFRELDSMSQRRGLPTLVEPMQLDCLSDLQDRGGMRCRISNASPR